MIKNYNKRKLGKTESHRRAMIRNLATSLLLHEKIQTTLAKAKELSRYSDRLITDAKPNDLNAKKKVAGEITNKEVRKKLSESGASLCSENQRLFQNIQGRAAARRPG